MRQGLRVDVRGRTRQWRRIPRADAGSATAGKWGRGRRNGVGSREDPNKTKFGAARTPNRDSLLKPAHDSFLRRASAFPGFTRFCVPMPGPGTRHDLEKADTLWIQAASAIQFFRRSARRRARLCTRQSCKTREEFQARRASFVFGATAPARAGERLGRRRHHDIRSMRGVFPIGRAGSIGTPGSPDRRASRA
jgi:hypothetical protein